MKRLLLVGAGHSHASVLKEFARHPLPNVEITLISPEAETPYSGMIPGWLADYYSWQECCIDFVGLCRRANVKFLMDEAIALDPDRQELVMTYSGKLSYDWLSLDIGSTMNAPSSVNVIPMRPLSRMHVFWNKLQRQVQEIPANTHFHLVTVGGGAAGVESTLAAYRSLTRIAPHVRFHFNLASASEDILPSMVSGAARRLKRRFAHCDIGIASNFSAASIENGCVVASDGRALQADAALWATGAEAHAWPCDSGILVDDNGFIRVESTLRSISHPTIFASGDCAGLKPPLPKAGVYAVRMGPVLANNLLNVLAGRPLRHYVPQHRYLSLIGSSDGSAVAAWGPLSWEGSWVWRWKQWIDRHFLRQYNLSAGA